ncbi:hypothetical protein [Polaribacter sp. IC073]|uniref:hypothetical protein n=1 Tax=Polaribacter sp. IC073 TaxID=2508540 RepID=UPI0011BDE3B4|nr:hypothetical protein [Polaribacter sp. IC073]TXD49128.1 hypothetical protein ES045_03420 [Polaribacter sp. IC073]
MNFKYYIKKISNILIRKPHLFVSNFLNKYILQKNLKKGILAITLNNSNGLGAKLIHALELMAICDKYNLSPMIKFTGSFDHKKEDVFDAFFEIKTSIKISKVKYAEVNNINTVLKYSASLESVPLNINYSHFLINKYIRVKDDVKKEIQDFVDKNFIKREVLGVHFRGTDKFSEAPRKNYEFVKNNISHYLKKYPKTNSIFVSSDENNFIKFLKESSIQIKVFSRDDLFRSDNSDPVHFSKNNVIEINREALVSMLLLSNCNTILKTASILSSVSKLFEPKVRVFLISKQFDEHRWFPEKELIKENILDPVE